MDDKLFPFLCLAIFSVESFYFAGSERNVSKLTLDGVDVMGDRLAEEVRSRLDILSAYRLQSFSVTLNPNLIIVYEHSRFLK